MRIYRDPETGELSAEPPRTAPGGAGTDAAAAVAGPDYNTVIMETLPDGSTNAIAREGQFHASVVVRIGADGKLAATCEHGSAGHDHAAADAEAP